MSLLVSRGADRWLAGIGLLFYVSFVACALWSRFPVPYRDDWDWYTFALSQPFRWAELLVPFMAGGLNWRRGGGRALSLTLVGIGVAAVAVYCVAVSVGASADTAPGLAADVAAGEWRLLLHPTAGVVDATLALAGGTGMLAVGFAQGGDGGPYQLAALDDHDRARCLLALEIAP